MWEAITIALQHPAFSTDQQLLCSVARVSTAWNTAVQQSVTRALDVHLDHSIRGATKKPPTATKQLTSFAAWLPKCTGLVCSISINRDYDNLALGGSDAEPAEALLEQTLRRCVIAPAAPAAQGHVQQHDPKPLQLQSYSSDVLHSNAILQSLPGGSLTRLTLQRVDYKLSAAALGNLPNLQALVIHTTTDRCFDSCMSAVSQLSRLTFLDVEGDDSFDTLQLPGQLQELHLTLRKSSSCAADGLQLSLQQHTGLTHLEVRSTCSLPGGAQLPKQLESLKLDLENTAATQSLQLTTLQQLKQLTILQSWDSTQDLLALSRLPNLQHVSLGYCRGWAAEAAVAWPHVRQLRSLQLGTGTHAPSPHVLFRCLSLATTLTNLELHCSVHGMRDVSVCKSLAALLDLQHLKLPCVGLDMSVDSVCGDVHHLSALTKLTCLDLSECRQLVSADALRVLAPQLTQLEKLYMHIAMTRYTTTLAHLSAVGAFKALKHLSVSGLSQDEQQKGLQLLTGLQHLTELQGFGSCSEEALRGFWGALEGGRST